jgi:hypothetical protein
VLPAMEEGLRHGGLAGVVGELVKLSLTPSRRLQLAAEATGIVALALRRSGPKADERNASFSRWRISAAPSGPMIDFDMRRACWQLDLLRCRGAEAKSWTVEAPHEKGRLAVPATWATDRLRRRNGGLAKHDSKESGRASSSSIREVICIDPPLEPLASPSISAGNPILPKAAMVTLPVNRTMRIYAVLARQSEPSGTRERLARHLLRKYAEGERDRNRLTVEGLSYLRAMDRRSASSE